MKLREYHPDKRPDSVEGFGQRVTQGLNEAWEILQDAARREAYDVAWNRECEWRLSPQERAEARRHEGNALYKAAQGVAKERGPSSLSGAAESLQHYQAAIVKYSEGLSFAPNDHRLRSNRALCYAAVKDWGRSREDALLVTQLKPDFMKGWFSLAKAYWKEGSPVAAQKELDKALHLIPGNKELLALQSDIREHMEACGQGDFRLPELPKGRGQSRSVSPSCTPPASCSGSRVATPPPIRQTSKSPARSQYSYRQASKSPGRHPADHFDNTAVFGDQTANFGRSNARDKSPSPAPSNPSGLPQPRQKTTLAGMVASSKPVRS